MISDRLTINPIPTRGLPPIDVAIECYKNWNSLVPFAEDLAHYLRYGVVISRPDIFEMLKIIDLRPKDEEGNFIGDVPEPAWYVRMAVGELRDLLAALPGYLPKICFCRHGNARMRIYSLGRLIELAEETKGGTQNGR